MRYVHWLRKLVVMGDSQCLLRGDGTRARQRATLLAGVMGLNDHPEYPLELTFQTLRHQGLGDAVATTEDALNREGVRRYDEAGVRKPRRAAPRGN